MRIAYRYNKERCGSNIVLFFLSHRDLGGSTVGMRIVVRWRVPQARTEKAVATLSEDIVGKETGLGRDIYMFQDGRKSQVMHMFAVDSFVQARRVDRE